MSTVEAGSNYEVHDIAVDGTHVYYNRVGGVFRVSKSGGPPEKLADNAISQGGIALDDTHVYWGGWWNSIQRVPKSGGPVELVVPPTQGPPPDQEFVTGLAVSGGVLVYGGKTSTPSPGFVRAVSVTGGAVTSLYDGSDGVVGKGCSPGAVEDVKTLGANAYFLHVCGAVAKVPIAGGAVTLLASSQPGDGSLAVGVAAVYWTGPQGLYAHPSSKPNGLVAFVPNAQGLVLDGDVLYLTSTTGLAKVLTTGSDVELLNVLGKRKLAVDDKSIYYSVNDSSKKIYGICVRTK